MAHAALSLCAVAATVAVVASQAPKPPFDSAQGKQAEWHYYGGNKGFTRYSSLEQITRDNVKQLRIAWRRPALNDKMIAVFPDARPNAYLRATPIMIDGVLYTQDAHGLVIALNGETGQTIWEQPFGADRDEARGASTRGVDYWRGGPANRDRRIFAIRGEFLYALDAATGVPVQAFGEKGRVLLRFADRQPLAGRFNDSTGPLRRRDR
jgi:quinoprotein glucose dehydrogenase